MLNKIINQQGQKAYQRGNDREDRSLVYRDWLRRIETNGFWCDLDFVKWKYKDGQLQPVAVTDLTRTDSDNVSSGYLFAIIQRVLYRDKQGAMLQKIGELLNIPVFLVLYPKSMGWIKTYFFKEGEWKHFSLKEWSNFLTTL